MQEVGLVPQDIQTIDDIVKLPFTVKQDLRDNYPFGLMAVPMSEIVRLHASSGTTGKPIVVGYTRKDLGIWEEVATRCLTAYGLTKNDSVQVSYGYGMFTGGLGLHGRNSHPDEQRKYTEANPAAARLWCEGFGLYSFLCFVFGRDHSQFGYSIGGV